MIFEIETGIIRISDPKDSKHSWTSTCLEKCKTGNWYPYFETLNKKNIALCATHNNIDIKSWKYYSANIKCDSGLLGIYDNKYYQDDCMVPDNFDFKNYKSGLGGWYDMNYIQSQIRKIGIVSFGCVIDCSIRIMFIYLHKTKKQIDGIRISFI